ncbi:hypothetical protein AHAS_Ahas19G0210100 [Arachis hypogaea]
MDMVQMQEAIERLSQQYMEIQEKQEEFYSQYMRSQQRQEELQLRMMSQQRDYESRSLEFTTLQDARCGVQADYNINSQIKLSYIAEHLHNIDPAFPTYNEYFKGRSEREVGKALLLEDRVKETMKKAGFGQKLKGKNKRKTIEQASEKKKKDK